MVFVKTDKISSWILTFIIYIDSYGKAQHSKGRKHNMTFALNYMFKNITWENTLALYWLW